jgi:hypothetical protein
MASPSNFGDVLFATFAMVDGIVMESDDFFSLRSEVIMTYFKTFEAADIRLSFLEGERGIAVKAGAGRYVKEAFPLMINLFTTGIGNRDLRDRTFIYAVDVMERYGQYLIENDFPDRPNILKDSTKLEKYKARIPSCDMACIRGFANNMFAFGENQDYPNYFDDKYIDFLKDISSIWPNDINKRMEVLNAIHGDYENTVKFHGEMISKHFNIERETIETIAPVASSTQLMQGAKEFMSHICVATGFSLIKEDRRNMIEKLILKSGIIDVNKIQGNDIFDELTRKNIKSADNHLNRLVIDFFKAAILVLLHWWKKSGKRMTPELITKINQVRHQECLTLGQGFSLRYNSYRELLKKVWDMDISKYHEMKTEKLHPYSNKIA